MIKPNNVSTVFLEHLHFFIFKNFGEMQLILVWHTEITKRKNKDCLRSKGKKGLLINTKLIEKIL